MTESSRKSMKILKVQENLKNAWKFMKINDDYQEIWTEIWVDT